MNGFADHIGGDGYEEAMGHMMDELDQVDDSPFGEDTFFRDLERKQIDYEDYIDWLKKQRLRRRINEGKP